MDKSIKHYLAENTVKEFESVEAFLDNLLRGVSANPEPLSDMHRKEKHEKNTAWLKGEVELYSYYCAVHNIQPNWKSLVVDLALQMAEKDRFIESLMNNNSSNLETSVKLGTEVQKTQEQRSKAGFSSAEERVAKQLPQWELCRQYADRFWKTNPSLSVSRVATLVAGLPGVEIKAEAIRKRIKKPGPDTG